MHLPQFAQLTQAHLTLTTWLCFPHLLHFSHLGPRFELTEGKSLLRFGEHVQGTEQPETGSLRLS